MRILLTGGGTLGHVWPHIAVLKALQSRITNRSRSVYRADRRVQRLRIGRSNEIKKLEVLYVGSRNGIEATFIPARGIPFVSIPVGKLRRYFDVKNFTDLFRMGAGILKSILILKRFKPDVIFSKGGYVSLPVILAGALLRIPIIIHDSDAIPGLTTRIAARFATKICLGYKESARFFPKEKVVVTGIPLRPDLFEGKVERALRLTGFTKKLPIVLVVGGTQGAERINQVVREGLPQLTQWAQVIHITGEGKKREVAQKYRKHYVAFEFMSERLPDFYEAANLIVSRAGATTIAEISALKKPAILIPMKQGSHGDQQRNAELWKKGGGKVMAESELTSEGMNTVLKVLWKSKTKSRPMRTAFAAGKISKLLLFQR